VVSDSCAHRPSYESEEDEETEEDGVSALDVSIDRHIEIEVVVVGLSCGDLVSEKVEVNGKE